MVATIKQVEAIPESYPDASAPAIWERIEAYIAHRFTPREVVWTVEGPGEWVPPLIPATVTTAEIWNGEAWEALTVGPAPLGGYWLSGCGPYRFTATVGGGGAPAAVLEACSRLEAYLAADVGMITVGAQSERRQVGDVDVAIERNPNWMARALQHSGAADLLRPYRRA